MQIYKTTSIIAQYILGIGVLTRSPRSARFSELARLLLCDVDKLPFVKLINKDAALRYRHHQLAETETRSRKRVSLPNVVIIPYRVPQCICIIRVFVHFYQNLTEHARAALG